MTARADQKHFTAAEVFELTGVRQQKAYQWDDRRVTIPSRKDKLASSSGDPHLRSIETVYQLAITDALVRLGIGPKLSARTARKFTDESQPGRAAGQCFEQGKTILLLSPDGPAVANVPFDANLFDVLINGAAIALDLNKVVADINAVLDNHKQTKRKNSR